MALHDFSVKMKLFILYVYPMLIFMENVESCITPVLKSLSILQEKQVRKKADSNPATSGLRLAYLHPVSQRTGSLCMSASTDCPNLSLVLLDSLYRSLCLKWSPVLCAKCVSISRTKLPSVNNIDLYLDLQTLLFFSFSVITPVVAPCVSVCITFSSYKDYILGWEPC